MTLCSLIATCTFPIPKILPENNEDMRYASTELNLSRRYHLHCHH